MASATAIIHAADNAALRADLCPFTYRLRNHWTHSTTNHPDLTQPSYSGRTANYECEAVHARRSHTPHRPISDHLAWEWMEVHPSVPWHRVQFRFLIGTLRDRPTRTRAMLHRSLVPPSTSIFVRTRFTNSLARSRAVILTQCSLCQSLAATLTRSVSRLTSAHSALVRARSSRCFHITYNLSP